MKGGHAALSRARRVLIQTLKGFYADRGDHGLEGQNPQKDGNYRQYGLGIEISTPHDLRISPLIPE